MKSKLSVLGKCIILILAWLHGDIAAVVLLYGICGLQNPERNGVDFVGGSDSSDNYLGTPFDMVVDCTGYCHVCHDNGNDIGTGCYRKKS